MWAMQSFLSRALGLASHWEMMISFLLIKAAMVPESRMLYVCKPAQADQPLKFIIKDFYSPTQTRTEIKALSVNLQLCSSTGQKKYCIESRYVPKARVPALSYHDCITEYEFQHICLHGHNCHWHQLELCVHGSDLICISLESMSLPTCTFKTADQANILFFLYQHVSSK